MIKRLFAVLLVTSTLGISGCGYAANNKESEAGKTMIDLNNMQDWCVGRYTFKLPKDTKIIDETINYDSFKIESQTKANNHDFEQAIATGIADYNDGVKLLLEETPVTQINKKYVKIFWGKLSRTRPTLGTTQVFAYVLDRGTLFFITGNYSEKFKKESRNGIQYLVENISARNNNQIPVDQGLCLKNGFIKDNGKEYKFSRQQIGFKIDKAPSVSISLETAVLYKNEQNLIQRMTENLNRNSDSKKFLNNVKDIQKGSKSTTLTPSISGLEWVLEIPMDSGTGISATWEHQGTVKDSLDPLISLGVDSDKKAGNVNIASIPNKNTLQMYEAILNSIRKF